MSALVSYDSSDEEEAPEQGSQPRKTAKAAKDVTTLQSAMNGTPTGPKANGDLLSIKDHTIEQDGPMVGPALGPSEPTGAYIYSPASLEENSVPLSPYSVNRARIRQLTLPPKPNLEIPDSPPGSPPSSTNAKFAHFLELKKQGINFNEKLAKSSALKNPSMMQKLMDFAEIEDTGQYSSSLPKELWDPQGFPEWAYKEELAGSQQKLLKKKEEEKTRGQRDSVDFVPAAASGTYSRGGTPGTGAGGRIGPKSAAERVMAGLDRGRSISPAVQAGVKRKTRFDS